LFVPPSAQRATRGLAWWVYLVAASLPLAYVLGLQAVELPQILRQLLSYGRDMLVTLALLAAAFGLGGLLLTPLRICFAELNALCLLLVGLGALALVILGLGVLGGFSVPILLLPILIGCFLAVALPTHRQLAHEFLLGFGALWLRLRSDGLALAALAVAAGGDVYALATNALVPPLDWDTVAYHLALPAIYLEHHAIISVPDILYSNWPFNLEMLYVPALLLGTERTAGFLALAFFAIGQMALVATGARYYTARAGALAAALYTGIPYVLDSVGTARVDVPLATWAFCAVVTFYDGLTHRNPRTLVLAGLLGGFAAGSKLTAATTLLVLGTILVGYCLVQRPPQWIRLLVSFVVAAAVVTLPWYVKSWLTTGNPIWPFLDQVFPSRDWDAYGSAIFTTWLHSFGTGVSLASFLALPRQLFLENTFGAPTGPLFLGLVPAAMLTRTRQGFSGFLGGFTLATVIIWFFLTQQPRLLSPALLTMSLLAGWGACSLLCSGPRLGRLILSLVLVAWLVGQSPLITGQAKLDDSMPFIRGAESRDTFLRRHVDVWPVFDYANTNLPQNTRILLLYYEVRGFYLQRDYVWGNPVSQRVIRWEQIPDAAAMDRRLAELGVTHIILTPRWYLPDAPYAKHFQTLVPDYLRQYAQPILTANGDTLYQVVHQPSGATAP
jgi:Dolichyl-phosphate-mannose-protein mannosyltransferase